MGILQEHGNFVYHAFISGLCKIYRINSVFEMLSSIRARGMPNNYMYDPLFYALLREGNLDLAFTVLDYVISSGCDSDISNCNTVL